MKRWFRAYLVMLLITSALSAAELCVLRGTILNEKGEPLQAANIVIPARQTGCSSDLNGYFRVPVETGTIVFAVSYMGYKTYQDTVTLTPGETRTVTVRLEIDYFQIGDVVVLAERELMPHAMETSTRISSGDIEHIQASSLGDIMQLVPGQRFENPGMSRKKQASVRTNVSDNDAEKNEFFGTQIIIDNIPLSNNANLQLDTKTTTPSGDLLTTENSGIDMRQIPADNLEEVEVVRGIPSVKYGDLTSGIVNVKTRSGNQSASLKIKYNFNNQEANLGGGFNLFGQQVDYNANYAHSVRNIRIPEENYSRIAGQIGMTSVLLDNILTLKNRIYYIRAFDERELRPDDLYYTVKYNRDFTLRYNNQTTYILSMMQKIDFNFAVNMTRQNSFRRQLISTDHTYVSDRMTEGWQEGIFVQNYMSELEVKGRAWNIYGDLSYNQELVINRTTHTILAGMTWRLEYNDGEGRIYNPLQPPTVTDNRRDRPRPYDDIPGLSTTSLYVEDKISGHFLMDYQFNLGVRYEMYGKNAIGSTHHGASLNPRINLMLSPFENTRFRFGFGRTSKSPSLAMLYPNPIYFDVDDINDIISNRVVVSTYIYSPENPDLQNSVQNKVEASFDQRIGNLGFSVTAFNNVTEHGFAATLSRSIFEYKYDRDDPDMPVIDSVFTTYSAWENSLTTWSRGIEASIQTRPVTPLNLQLRMEGSYTYTTSEKENAFDYATTYRYDPELNERVKPYWYPITMEADRFLINYILDFRLKELGAWATIIAQQVVFDRDRFLGLDDSLAVGYLTPEGNRVLLSNEEGIAFIRSQPDYNYRTENRKNIWVFNFRATKGLGKNTRVSFFVNNFLNSHPLYQRKRTPTESFIKQNPDLYFGLELSVQVDKLFAGQEDK